MELLDVKDSSQFDFADQLLTAAGEGLVVFDKSLRVLHWSSVAEEMSGMSPLEVLGRGIPELFPFVETTGEIHRLRDVIRGLPCKSLEQPYWVGNKEKSGLFSANYLPYKVNGKIEGGMAVVSDVTQLVLSRERLGETEQLFKNMADHSPVLLWLAGADGLCTFFNQTWLDFTGRSLAQEWGVGWSEGVHPEDFQRCVDTYIAAFNQRQVFEMEYRLLRHDGVYRWILDRGAPRYTPDGSFTGFVGSCIDITDRRSAEEDLLAAKKAAESASTAKTYFLANVSHEIRTPLGLILGFSEMLVNSEVSPSEKNNLVSSIKLHGDYLLQVVDDILDISKIEAGALHLEMAEIDTQTLLTEIAGFAKIKTREKDLTFKLELARPLPKIVRSDRFRLYQILTNILSNAAKFTDRGRIEVVVDHVPASDPLAPNHLTFTVVDTGIGIPLEKQKKLFNAFMQIDPTHTRKYGGTGLGLALSQRLARALGGDVALIESTPGRGSRFQAAFSTGFSGTPEQTITEIEIKNETVPAGPALVAADLSGVRVLLTEDSIDNQVLISHFLKPHGIKLDIANDGVEALQKVEERSDYDLIFMDIQMPNKDGFQATKELRERGFAKPIIALTAHAMKDQKARSMKAGFTDYLTKPINQKLLVKTVERYTNHSIS